jgi:hypothetical protein
MKRILPLVSFLSGLFFLFTGAWAQDGWESVKDPVKVFEEGYIQVVGVSEEGQKRYGAMRAATVVAQRDLLEILEGLRLYGETTVKNGMLQSDEIRTTIQGFLKGAVKCGEKFNRDAGYAEVCMRLYIRGKGGLYDVILPLIKENKLNPVKKTYYNPKLIPKVISETPADVPKEQVKQEVTKPVEAVKVIKEEQPVAKPQVAAPSEIVKSFDGLIIDVRDFQFRPALVNTILTENEEIVFDPAKILSSVLVERGCGGFTTDPGKAEALLESWGSKNPMTLKCIGVVKMTNAKVSVDDAAAIYVHDKNSHLLAQAKVVFLLK